MKKNFFLSTGIIVVLSLALAACGKADTPASNGASSSSTTAGSSASSDMTAGSGNTASGEDIAAGSINMSSSDDIVSGVDSTVKLLGTFEGQNEMKAAGTAVIENGQLKLSKFSVSEGPDLHVYLANGNDAANGTEIGKIDLKSTEQSFDAIPRESYPCTTPS